MRYFFTSDRHFFHRKILTTFCPTTRHGDTVEEMHELMIEAHNRVVGPDDVVYDLGDITFGSPVATRRIMDRMNGRHILILGNHDRKALANPQAKVLFDYYESIHEKLVVECNGQTIHLDHFPHREWDKMHFGSWHLYGHVHGSLGHVEWGKSMDVGIDSRDPADMAPWSFEEIEAIMENRKVLSHHGD